MSEYRKNPKPNPMTKPILPGTAATDYERYLRTDELLSLQKPVDQLVHPDEMMFQVVHQSSEILLKGVGYELERARRHIAEGSFRDACRLLRRANQMLDYPIQLLHVLETFTPYDYHLIRAGLGHGSGLDSPGFLRFKQVEKAGIELEEMYRRNADFTGLHDVAECMLDFDERVQIFRYHHLKLAHRIIGAGVLGTTGRPVEILEQRMEHCFYRKLWDVRNEITANANAAKAAREKPTKHKKR